MPSPLSLPLASPFFPRRHLRFDDNGEPGGSAPRAAPRGLKREGAIVLEAGDVDAASAAKRPCPPAPMPKAWRRWVPMLLDAPQSAQARQDAERLAQQLHRQHGPADIEHMLGLIDALGHPGRRAVLGAVLAHVQAPFRPLFLRCAEALLVTEHADQVALVQRAARQAHQTPFDRQSEQSAKAQLSVLHDALAMHAEATAFAPRAPDAQARQDSAQLPLHTEQLRAHWQCCQAHRPLVFSPQSMVALMDGCVLPVDGPAPSAQAKKVRHAWRREEQIQDGSHMPAPLYRSTQAMDACLGESGPCTVSAFLAHVWMLAHDTPGPTRTQEEKEDQARVQRANRRASFWAGIADHLVDGPYGPVRPCVTGLAQKVLPALAGHIDGIRIDGLTGEELVCEHAARWQRGWGEKEPSVDALVSALIEGVRAAEQIFVHERQNPQQWAVYCRHLGVYGEYSWPSLYARAQAQVREATGQRLGA